MTIPTDQAGGPRVTVVCSTHRRAQLLPRLIAALESQTMAPTDFEVVVVDDGSPDDTPEVLARLSRLVPFPLEVRRNPTNLGAAAGRNVGWRAAAAPIIAFTDDDCRPTPGWLEAGTRAAERAGPGTFIGGPTLPDPTESHWLKLPFSRSLTVEEPKFFETCNIFYHRSDLAHAGGLDEEFSTGEDTDLAYRLLEDGRSAGWEPAAVVHHQVRPPSFASSVREARRWSSLPLVVKRHRRSIGPLVHRRWFWKTTHPPTIVALLGLVFAVVTRRALPAGAVAWWLWHRMVRNPPCPGPRRRLLAAPGAFVVDVVEVATMVEGSIRHRTVLL